jgi:hypothetical protein
MEKRFVAKRPERRKGRPATGRPLLSRENSSNGVSKKTIRTFLAKSYWAAKGSVKEFFQNKCLCFQ